MASTQLNLYEAKTHLSSLVDRAAKGEEIIIAKAGKPMAKLSAVSVEDGTAEPLPWGQNLLGLSKLPESFYEDILLWIDGEPGRFTGTPLQLLLHESNVYVSAATAWELAIKLASNKLSLPVPVSKMAASDRKSVV